MSDRSSVATGRHNLELMALQIAYIYLYGFRSTASHT